MGKQTVKAPSNLQTALTIKAASSTTKFYKGKDIQQMGSKFTMEPFWIIYLMDMEC